MEFIKKHYEKVLLGVVLLGLTAAVAFLPFIIKAKRAALEEKSNILSGKAKPVPPLDMSRESSLLQRAESPFALDFTTKHRLFNPALWLKKADGELIKVNTGAEIGVGALEITAIKPLYLKLTYNGPSADGYLIGVEREGARKASDRRPRETFILPNGKNDVFALRAIKGPADKPTELNLALNDTGDVISIGPDKPFQKVDGYSVDLKYGPEGNKTWPNRREDDSLKFGGESYKIIAIGQSNVVVSAESNKKRTTISFNPPSEQR